MRLVEKKEDFIKLFEMAQLKLKPHSAITEFTLKNT
jgi:hypothetical protein